MRLLFWTMVGCCGVLLAGGGCTKYEFDLARPENIAQHISKGGETTFRVGEDPIVYHAEAYEGRLVLRIENTSEAAIELSGPPSYVIDPANETRPIRTMAIAPHAFSKLILPPMRPVYRSEPSFGIGVGIGVDARHGRSTLYGDPLETSYWSSPRYFMLIDDSNAYWDWDGETTIRVHLTYQGAIDQRWTHDLEFNRVKAK